MKRIIVGTVLAFALSSCATTDDREAAIKQACNTAELAIAAIDPWAEAGQLSAKSTRAYTVAKETLFAPGSGICVIPPTGNLAAILVRVSSMALNLSIVLKDK